MLSYSQRARFTYSARGFGSHVACGIGPQIERR